MGNVKVLNTVLYMSVQGTIVNTVLIILFFYISINSPQLWHEAMAITFIKQVNICTQF